MSDAFTGGLTFRTDVVLASTFVVLPEVLSLSGVGKTNEQLEVTNFDSAGSKEYIAGLADGAEVSVECNLVNGDAQQEAVIAAVDSGTNFSVELAVTNGVTAKTYGFEVTPISWNVTPAVNDKHMIAFSLKISGAITIT